jgi:hypothetical protein
MIGTVVTQTGNVSEERSNEMMALNAEDRASGRSCHRAEGAWRKSGAQANMALERTHECCLADVAGLR